MDFAHSGSLDRRLHHIQHDQEQIQGKVKAGHFSHSRVIGLDVTDQII
jgi:hypothetical protein